MRRGDVLAALKAEVGVAQVIGEEDDDVGLPGCFLRHGWRDDQQQPDCRSQQAAQATNRRGAVDFQADRNSLPNPVPCGRVFMKSSPDC